MTDTADRQPDRNKQYHELHMAIGQQNKRAWDTVAAVEIGTQVERSSDREHIQIQHANHWKAITFQDKDEDV